MEYNILYVDIPWFYNSRCTWSKTKFGGGANGQYKTMTTESLCKLAPYIDNITHKDCFLFMWATFPNLKDALKVIDAWGFVYKTDAFLWVKTNPKATQYIKRMKKFVYNENNGLDSYIENINENLLFFGTGCYTKSNTEPCLLAVKSGMKPKSFIKNNDVSSVIVSPRQEHSKKPDEIRNRIVRLLGNDLPKLEMFGRTQTPEWDVIGEEIDGRDIREALVGKWFQEEFENGAR